ncbi:MAG: RecQ family ATP-dependent DNA helicase [Melioribacteraceae bacterium]
MSKVELVFNKYRQQFHEINNLYDYQKRALEKLLSHINTLCIIPTGGGKSLIFQLAAQELEGITIVISPLLALMREQTSELEKKGIFATSLNSEISFDNQREYLRNLSSTNTKLLYVSPERLQNTLFRASLSASKIKVSLIVIDEAHCISQWGHGFRPDYNQIKPFIEFLRSIGNFPIIFALTATLNQKPRADILNSFEIEKDNVIVSEEIIRDNLKLEFKEALNEEEKAQKLLDFHNGKNPKKMIVYLYSQLRSEEYSALLNQKGFSTGFFHAGMDADDKETTYNDFRNGKIEILFATTAFGMGMNIPDIDSVVHLQLPESIEEYYQHVGRGGRKKDICPICNCLLIWTKTNVKRRREQIENERYSFERLEMSFKQLGLTNKAGKIVNKDKEGLHDSKNNLPLIIDYFEKYGIIESLGELNGSPLKIELYNNTPLWNKIISSIDDIDSFVLASTNTGVKIEEIIQHVFEQEFIGNIKKLPAVSRQLFFKCNVNELQKEIANKIIEEINSFVDFRLTQYDEFIELFSSNTPNEYICSFLQ